MEPTNAPHRSQQPSINVATESYLQLIESSSERRLFPATNLIKDSASLDYHSQEGLPQDVTIHLSPVHLSTNDATQLLYNSINFAGWHCSSTHENLSPRVVRLHVARFDTPLSQPHFQYWCTLRAKKPHGTHLFRIKPVPRDYTKFRFEFVENFSSEHAEQAICLNRLFLVSQDLNLDIEPRVHHTNHDMHSDTSFDAHDDGSHDSNQSNPKLHTHPTLPNQQTLTTNRRTNLTDLTDGLDDPLLLTSSRPQPRKPLPSHTSPSLPHNHELHQQLNNTSQNLESLHNDFSQLLQHATTHDQKELHKKYQQMQDSIMQCQEGIKHVKLYMNQLSDRVQMLEEMDLKKFMVEQKRTNIGLNNRIGDFKKTFRDQTDEKLKRAYEKIEKKLEDRMRLMLKRHRDSTDRQIQRILEKNLVNIRISHPENEKIREYNDKVQYVNRQQIKFNSKVYVQQGDKDSRPTKQHLQKKFLPEFFELQGEFIGDSAHEEAPEDLWEPNESPTEKSPPLQIVQKPAGTGTRNQVPQLDAYDEAEREQQDQEIGDASGDSRTPHKPLASHLAAQLKSEMQEEQDIMESLSQSLRKYNFQF